MAYNDEEEKFPEEEGFYEEKETGEEVEDEMDAGEKEADVYTEEGREKLEEDDTLNPREEGFMEGEEMLGEDAVCAQCGKVLGEDIEREKIIAREVAGKREFFCSNRCADAYEKEHSGG